MIALESKTISHLLPPTPTLPHTIKAVSKVGDEYLMPEQFQQIIISLAMKNTQIHYYIKNTNIIVFAILLNTNACYFDI